MSSTVETVHEIRPFDVDIPEEALDDLRRRVAATRWLSKELVNDRSQGVQLATIQALARYWASDYDWRKCDNDYQIWTAFANHYWPACYFVDAQGQIRHHRFGEGDDQMSEMVLQQLLTEAGGGGTDQELSSVDARGVEVAADWNSLGSPETYLGYARTGNFVSPNGSILETSYAYAAPPRLGRNHWALSGDWTVNQQAIVGNQAGGRILYRFHARDLHLVMAPTTPGGLIRFRVHLDGQPPGAAHGTDVDDQGTGTLTEPRLYQLLRQPGPLSDRTLEITFLAPGVQAYAFTFG